MISRATLIRIVVLLLLAAGIGWMLAHRDLLAQESIGPAVLAFGYWAPIGFILVYAAATTVFFSGAILSLVGGALFGPVWGTAWNLTGATLGATIAFLLARTVAGDWVAGRVGGRLRRLVDGVTAEGWRFVALMRLVPLVPFNLLNYALGLTGISLPAYIVTSAACMLPGATAYTWLGYAGRSAATGDTRGLRYGLLGLGVLAMIAFLPRLFRRFRAQEPKWIESDELQRRISAGDTITLLDVRQPDEFTAPPGHLPRAINVPLAELADRIPELAEHKRSIVIVCKTDRRSARAATEMLAAGLKDVAVLRGGTDGWHQRGLALEMGNSVRAV
jgi:uncharacterized membrane protein YdjX (TVP38/TMEM64 family)/rhodanese-related sulfurtransferase